MSNHADKSQENRSQSAANAEQLKQDSSDSALAVESRPAPVAQRRLQDMADQSAQVGQLKALQQTADGSPQVAQLKGLQQSANSSQAPVQMNKN